MALVTKRNILLILSAVAAGVLSVIVPFLLRAPFVIALGGILAGAFLIRFAGPEDRKALLLIFIGGLFLRFALSILFFNISFWTDPQSRGFFIGDGNSYGFTGWWIATQWKIGIFPGPAAISRHSGSGAVVGCYEHWCAFVYLFAGKNPLALFFLNSLAGSLSAIFIYLLARRLFNRKAALLACLFSQFWPSLVLWSTQNLREPITILLLTISLLVIVNLRYGFKFSYVIIFIILFFFLAKLQDSAAIMLGLAVLISLPLSLHKRLAARIFAAAGFLILLFFLSGLHSPVFIEMKQWFINRYNLSLESINHLRYARTLDANSAFLTGVNISSLPRALVFLPFGLLFFFLAPFPWQLGNLIQILAVPEMILWYCLLPFTYSGILFSVRERWKESSCIILFILLMSCLFSLFEGNVGTLFRHRSIVLIFLLLFASAGVVRAWESRAD